jgi:hypothetical protein
MAYMLANGISDMPRDSFVCHSCDNPSCCNPEHLWRGTATDNMRDMFEKGRGNRARGISSGKAKLTDAMVIEILRSSETCRALARRMGVSPGTIENVRNRRTWRHVEAA